MKPWSSGLNRTVSRERAALCLCLSLLLGSALKPVPAHASLLGFCASLLVNRITETYRIEQQASLPRTRSEIVEIFLKVKNDPVYALSEEEKIVLDSRGLLPELERFRNQAMLLRAVRAYHLAYRAYSATLKSPQIQAEARRHYLQLSHRLFSDPEARLSKEDTDLLQRMELPLEAGPLREMGRQFGKPLLALGSLSRGVRLAFTGLVLAGMIQHFGIGERTMPRDPEARWEQLGPDEFEQVVYGFHAVLRVGDFIYDYYPSRVRKTTLERWERQSRNYSNAPRTVIRFKVTSEEVAALKRFLDDEAGNRFFFLVFPGLNISGCVSKANQAINRTVPGLAPPDGLGHSLVHTKLWYKTRAATGERRIRWIRFHPGDRPEALARGPDFIYAASDSFFSSLFLADQVIYAQFLKTGNGFTYRGTRTADWEQQELLWPGDHDPNLH